LRRDGSGNGIRGVRDSDFVDGAERGPDEQRQVRKVAIGELRADREGLRCGMRGHGQGVAGRDQVGGYHLAELPAQLLLQGGGQQIRSKHQIAE
jgi:hypothetical protein